VVLTGDDKGVGVDYEVNSLKPVAIFLDGDGAVLIK